jgi:hypothetical protein
MWMGVGFARRSDGVVAGIQGVGRRSFISGGETTAPLNARTELRGGHRPSIASLMAAAMKRGLCSLNPLL